MKALELYDRLEKDFILPGMSDEWAKYMQPIADFLTDNYKERSMGLVCDNTGEVNSVYTAVFPSKSVMQSIIHSDATDALLFLHHPSVWDSRNAPVYWQLMDREQLRQFRERNISIYNLHVPLDNFSEYSTSATLARALDITDLKPFYEYYGGLAAVFGKTAYSTVQQLSDRFTAEMGHETSLYQYGLDEITGNRVAMVGGGGNIPDLLAEIVAAGVNVLVTGITVKDNIHEKAHDYAREQGINIMGATHYSTEKPACVAMCDYFEKLGLPAEFIDDEPVLEDL
jgi:putative NIF3 family GTP cyclohydrolase 1 type 2